MSATGRIDSLGARGEGVLRMEDRVIFIPGALPGEEVTFEITSMEKRFDVGTLLEVVSASPDRRNYGHVAPPGPAYVIPATPEAVANWKTDLLRHRIAAAGLGEDLVAPPKFVADAKGSRNFLRYAVLKKGRVGFRAAKRDKGTAVTKNSVAHPLLEELRESVDGRLGGLESVALRVGTETGEKMAIIEGQTLPPKLDPVSFDGSLVGLDDQGHLPIKGLPWLFEKVCGINLRIAAPTWFPICTPGAELLVRTVEDLAPKSQIVWDLSAGCGLMTLIAFRDSEKVFAAESEPYALDDLRENVGETHRVSIRKQRTDDLVRDQNAVRERANTILAWRRNGRLDENTRKELLAARADRILLIGDDTPGLIEDLRALDESWKLVKLQPVDTIPCDPRLLHVAVLHSKKFPQAP